MRTGSIGNRDAESLINTLVEPKRSLLGGLRLDLLSLGYSEEAGYDPINVESYVSYSVSGVTRFIFKHKWSLSVTVVLSNDKERHELADEANETSAINFARSEQDDTVWAEFDPKEERELILKIARILAKWESS